MRKSRLITLAHSNPLTDTQIQTRAFVMSLDDWHKCPEYLSPRYNAYIEGDEVIAVAVDVYSDDGEIEPDEDPDFNPVFKLKKPWKKRASLTRLFDVTLPA